MDEGFGYALFLFFLRRFFLACHFGNIFNRELIKPLMAIFGIIAMSHFKLLHKATCIRGAEFTEQNFEAFDVKFVRGEIFSDHRDLSIAWFGLF